MKILISEDDPVSRKILSHLLSPFGQCVETVTGTQALEAYRAALDTKQPFELIVLDLILPEMRGIEVLAEVRRIESERGVPPAKAVPALMLTGESDTKQITIAQSLGISKYILKPIDGPKLVRELQRLGLIADPQDQWS